ncbi:Glycerophosphoinositol inositolphosphodiesterase GDPD2 [Triplophysa tibetana]|uniref:Glycerophosphoinositol inositolphosphodiesterase GDPD2 n=1 Tax=Triplophysa tibetana TaxID=1572043 RepID=A0A5A9NK92_9TELE|nr:Glycerophosphoinositol inositolphosphodiesterase GDPD2 [Triplophysa tibetana]
MMVTGRKVLLSLGLLIVTLGTAGFSVKWKEEWHSVEMSFQATAPFLQLGAVVALTLISWLVFQSYHRAKAAACKFFIMMSFLIVSAAVFLCPLVICSPCITSNLPPKPALVGHRGAPMLAPENTLMSFKRSLQCDVEAFETDVQLSEDKKPFLMHDHGSNFLLRTTDVKNTFTDRGNGTHTSFSWDELQMLNAGEWFLKTDPFWTVSRLTEGEKNQSKEQKVPSLNELLDLAKENNISLIFDLKNENNFSEFNDSDSYYTVETIKKSGISPEKIWWLPAEHRHKVSNIEPGFKQVYNIMSDMEEEGGNFLNVKYSSLSAHEISKLRERNVSVNVWVVNERWLFSLLWCSGVTSVTTNACHIFKDMKTPDWHLHRFSSCHNLHIMVHKYDTKRAVGLLKQYQAGLTSPEEQSLKISVEKVSAIFGSHLFQALLGEDSLISSSMKGAQSVSRFKGTLVAPLLVTTGQRQLVTLEVNENLSEEGVSLVRVTSRRSPQKVERVSGLVSCSHVETPKHPQRHLVAQCLRALAFQMSGDLAPWLGDAMLDMVSCLPHIMEERMRATWWWGEMKRELQREGEDGGACRGPVQCNAVRDGTDT